MSNKDIENWLLSKVVFVDCRKCVNRKEGCNKNCKFFKSYMRNRGE